MIYDLIWRHNQGEKNHESKSKSFFFLRHLIARKEIILKSANAKSDFVKFCCRGKKQRILYRSFRRTFVYIYIEKEYIFKSGAYTKFRKTASKWWFEPVWLCLNTYSVLQYGTVQTNQSIYSNKQAVRANTHTFNVDDVAPHSRQWKNVFFGGSSQG